MAEGTSLVHCFQTMLEDGHERFSTSSRFLIPFLTLYRGMIIFVVSLREPSLCQKPFERAKDIWRKISRSSGCAGTNLAAMDEVAKKVDAVVRQNPEVTTSVLTVGDRDGQTNVATFFVELVPTKQRRVNTSELKERVRGQLKPFAYANPAVKDVDMFGAGQRVFNVNVTGTDLGQLERYSQALLQRLKNDPALLDVDTSFRPGRPEFQVKVDNHKAERLGVSSAIVGGELRNLIEGATPALFREDGKEYDIRVRLQEDQRNLRAGYLQTYVPNINNVLVRLSNVANPIQTEGPSNILRQDRGRYIQIRRILPLEEPAWEGRLTTPSGFWNRRLSCRQRWVMRSWGRLKTLETY